ncbi:MAG TPA: hypothetical protein VII12_20290 [Thermoanaerobaculia bacterium]|jgi:hypothetical protein
MKRIALLVSLLGLSSALAQEMPKPELYIIHEEIIKPSSMMAYEVASKDFVNALAEKKVSSPALTWNAYVTNDMHYLYVVRIPNFAAMDSSMAEWDKAKTAVGAARWADLERRGSEGTASYNEIVTMRRPDLSYMPANPRLKIEEEKYVRLDFYYLQPGKQAEAEAIARDYVALFKQKDIAERYSIFITVLGEDLPLLVAAIGAKSEADSVSADERVNATLGADVRPLQARAMAITRKFERRQALYRPDLSYPSAMK